MTADRDRIIDLVAAEVGVLADRYTRGLVAQGRRRRGFCIGASRIAGDALAYFGIDSDPWPCYLDAMNAAFVAWVKEHDRMPGDADVPRGPDGPTRRVRFHEQTGAWYVGIGYDPTPEEDDGNAADCHLVLRVGDLIVDPSIGQASRPEYGMPLPVSFVGPFADPAQFTDEAGTTIVYRGKPEARGWKSSPDWSKRRREYQRAFVGGVIRNVKGAIR